MSPQQKLFHFLVLCAFVFSTLPPPSISYQWKALPPRKLHPETHPASQRHSMSVDGQDQNLAKIAQDSGTLNPFDKPELAFYHVTDDVSAARGQNDGNESEAGKEGKLAKEGKLGNVGPSGKSLMQSGKAGDDTVRIAVGDEGAWLDEMKRKWGQNSLSVWGKRESSDRERRKWGENTMSVWGKRDDDDDDDDDKEKRKWGENTMSVWGKRSTDQTEKTSKEKKPEVIRHAAEVTSETEKLNETPIRHRQLSKRSVYDDLDEDFLLQDNLYNDLDLPKRSQPRRRSFPRPYDGPKRNWETNTMKVWGKRDHLPTWDDFSYIADPADDKRKWTSENAIRIWGKRDPAPIGPFDEENFFG